MLGTRRVLLTPTSEPDGNHQCPFRESKGARASEASSRGMSVQGPSERVLLSGTRLPASLDGGGYRASERNNRAMTGAALHDDASRRADGLATSAVLDY